MTIEEAIKHAADIANKRCDECGHEHRQLCEWLLELKDRRMKMEPAKVINLDETYDPFVMKSISIGDCDNCGRRVARGLHEYCPGCGKELEWPDTDDD